MNNTFSIGRFFCAITLQGTGAPIVDRGRTEENEGLHRIGSCLVIRMPFLKHRPSKALVIGIWRRTWATVAPANWASAPEPVKPRSIDITLRQAWELVEFFGGHDCEVTVSEGPGHAGPGLYAYCTEYPEEGAWHLGRTEVDESLAIGARLSMPGKTAESVLREMLDMAKTGDADLDESWAGVMADAAAVLARRPLEFVDVVLDGAPGPDSGRFVELHDSAGKGLKYGEWLQSADGYSVLRLPIMMVMQAPVPEPVILTDLMRRRQEQKTRHAAPGADGSGPVIDGLPVRSVIEMAANYAENGFKSTILADQLRRILPFFVESKA